MYYTGLDPRTMEEVYVPVNPHEKAMQRALIQYRRPENYSLVYEALTKAGREDLIGYDKKCLIRPKNAASGSGAVKKGLGTREFNTSDKTQAKKAINRGARSMQRRAAGAAATGRPGERSGASRTQASREAAGKTAKKKTIRNVHKSGKEKR
jgi:hypothetical protein